MSITFRQMNISELYQIFPPDRQTQIFVYERLDPRTLEHVQADEGRYWLQALIAHPRKMRRRSKRNLQFGWGTEPRRVNRSPGNGVTWAGIVDGGKRA